MRMSIKALVVFLAIFFSVPVSAQEKKPSFDFKFDYPIVNDSTTSTGRRPLLFSFQDGVTAQDNIFDYMNRYFVQDCPSVCFSYMFTTLEPLATAGVLRQGGKFEPGDISPFYGKRASSSHESGFPIGLDFEKRIAGNLWASIGYHRSKTFTLDVDEWVDFFRTETVETIPFFADYTVSYLTISRRYSARKLQYKFVTHALDLGAKVNLLKEGGKIGIFPHAGAETWFVRKNVLSDTKFYRYTAFMPEFYNIQPSSARALDYNEKIEANENVRLERFPVGVNLETYFSKHIGVSFDTNFYLGERSVRFDNHESLWESFSTDIRLPRKVFYVSGIVRF